MRYERDEREMRETDERDERREKFGEREMKDEDERRSFFSTSASIMIVWVPILGGNAGVCLVGRDDLMSEDRNCIVMERSCVCYDRRTCFPFSCLPFMKSLLSVALAPHFFSVFGAAGAVGAE